MSQGSRNASEILLAIEIAINHLIKMVDSQNLLLKNMTNLLNNKSSVEKKPPQITVEAVNTKPTNIVSKIDPERNILISAEDSLPVENQPKGFRRSSRPETYSGDNSYLKKAPPLKEAEIKFPVQVPRSNGGTEVISKVQNDVKDKSENIIKSVNNNAFPVEQRIVDGRGKAIFLADVEIFNDTNQSIYKTRTNAVGKWSAALVMGDYKVVIRKRDAISKEPKEAAQSIQIDGSSSQVKLPVMIIK